MNSLIRYREVGVLLLRCYARFTTDERTARNLDGVSSRLQTQVQVLESREMDEVNRRTHPRCTKYAPIVFLFMFYARNHRRGLQHEAVICDPLLTAFLKSAGYPEPIIQDEEARGTSVTPK